MGKDKLIMEKRVSARNIQAKFNKLSRKLKEKGKNKKISLYLYIQQIGF